jgi:Fe-S-cluster containining protein
MGLKQEIDALWEDLCRERPEVGEEIRRSLALEVRPASWTYDCSSCTRKACCKTYNNIPPCSIYDAIRLIEAGMGDYIEGTLDEDGRDDENQLRIKRKDGACALLEDDRCKHYEFRPLVCRIYPYVEYHQRFGQSGHVITAVADLCERRPSQGNDGQDIQKLAEDIHIEVGRTIFLVRHKRAELKKTALGTFLD